MAEVEVGDIEKDELVMEMSLNFWHFIQILQ